MSNPKNDACVYILTALLQRLDNSNPGIITDILEGIKTDRSSIPKNIENKEYIESIYIDALSIMERAQLLSKKSDNA